MKFEELAKYIQGARIVSADGGTLALDNGMELELYESDWDCCASAFGEWSPFDLEAGITNVTLSATEKWDDGDTFGEVATLTVLHGNQALATAEMSADAGNGGYYFSILSLRVKTPRGIEMDGEILSSYGATGEDGWE